MIATRHWALQNFPRTGLMCLLAALVLPVVGCKSKPVDLPELYATRAAGTTFLERGQLPEAETQFKKLTDLAPDDPLGYANLGLTYLRAGRYDDAEKQLRRAQKLDPSSAEVGFIVARLYSLTGRWDEARSMLEKLQTGTPPDAKVLYALAELEARGVDTASSAAYEQRLRAVLAAAPANVAVRVKLAKIFARRGQADSTVKYLEETQRLRPEPPAEAQPLLASALQLLRAGKVAEAKETLDRFFHLMELSQPYQASLADVKWLEGPIVGRPVLAFKPQSLIKMLGAVPGKTADQMRFVDATIDAGFPEPVSVANGSASAAVGAMVAADFTGDGADELFVSLPSNEATGPSTRFFNVRAGQAIDVTQQWGASIPGGAALAAAGDIDNDGWLDLFVIGTDGRARLLKNAAGRKLEDLAGSAGIGDVTGARKALFVDLDHDGDLDLLVVGTGNTRVFQNASDGRFTEVGATIGLAQISGVYDAAYADFDGDGRVDLIFATEGGARIFHNTGMRRFEDATSSSGLASVLGAVSGVAVSDYDNDGLLDVTLAQKSSGEARLFRGIGDGTFARDTRSDGALATSRALTDPVLALVDVDNDGWLDLAVTGSTRGNAPGTFLFHNDRSGTFENRSRVLPASIRGARVITASDVDADGDLDLYLTDASGLRVLRNEDGNASLSLQVSLVGLRTGSGKNNTFGIGAKLEVRSGELFQTRVVTSSSTHFGLGKHLKADVLRVEWPNGVPQTIYFPGTDQDVLELEQLKGSCAFAYTWDGKQFRFVTDVMWRSALGMPLGLMAAGGGSAFAPAGASQEYLRIPGDFLRPRDGKYVMQLTEELWETAYTDEIRLLAVDHPDSVDVFVDERFVPPGPVKLRLYNVAHRQLPLSAVDEHGDDVLPALRANDDVYVSNLSPTQFQGVVEPHEIVLDLGRDAGRPGTYLFLRGWIYPTDASINIALAQQSKLKVTLPALEVRDASGRWRTVADIGFPSGKNKTVIVDLAGKFPTADHHVRIRTTMQIYWDQAFVGEDVNGSPVKITTLAPQSADLHFRGFSKVYRKGGRYGPYWFAYDSVTRESPWRTIDGAFTRFGSVLPLLGKSDDMYVVMGPGDETTLEFDASSADSVPKGWKRDFLLYSDGWIKDSDLNTAHGTSVGPLPYHAMRAYPYGPGDGYPTDSAHQEFLRTYSTRLVKRGLSRR